MLLLDDVGSSVTHKEQEAKENRQNLRVLRTVVQFSIPPLGAF